MDVAAPDTVVSCPHAATCPGCDHLGVPYAKQLEAKAASVDAALAYYPELRDLPRRAPRGAATIEAYRTRAKWVFSNKRAAGKRGALGLYERGGHVVVDLPSCKVVSEVVAGAGAAVREVVRGGAFPAVTDSLRAIDAREVQDGDGATRCLLTLVLVRERRPSRRDLVAAAHAVIEREPRIAGVSVNWAPAKSVQILGDETEHVEGTTHLLDRYGEILVTATPGSFVQAHRGQAAAMAAALVEGARALAGPSRKPRVLELFGGSAPFGLALAKAGCDVTSVESYAPAAQGVQIAAAAQGLAVHAIADDATRATGLLAREGARFDLVVVDPPRRGLTPALRAAIATLAPKRVAYVSCDPTTLARDLAALTQLGLRPTSVEPWDFIPLTSHVEALAWLAPAAPPPLAVLARDGARAIVDAPPHLPTGTVLERAAKQLGTRPLGIPPWDGASGARLVGVDRAEGHAKLLVAVRGKPRRDLGGPWSQLAVRRSHEGRSLVEIEAPLTSLPALGRALARAGHPVLGDPGDAPTSRHLAEKHGVDRPLAHVASLVIQGASTLQPAQVADIPGELAAALARLGLSPAEGAFRP